MRPYTCNGAPDAIRRVRQLAAAVCAGILLAGCASSPDPGPLPGPVLSDPPAIHWTRTAAEHKAAFLQTYDLALERVEAAARDLEPRRWVVSLDADETVLDNSEYQSRRAALGLGFTTESWNEWVREEAAGVLPGAVQFVRRVRVLGGRIAIVTNRDEEVCENTRRNLAAVGIGADVVLCRAPGEEGKEGRYEAIAEGNTMAGLPPLEIVAWIGDNIEDFPGGSQAMAGQDAVAFRDFGQRYFLVPNPMYGSWERNPPVPQ